MKKPKLEKMSVNQLLDQFAEIGVAQDKALLESAISTFNRLFDQMVAIEDELKARDGDQRHFLLELYKHPNMQVRLNAAKATLAVSPIKAREMLRKIEDSEFFPQAGDAGMSLWNLDRGVYKPI